MKIFYKYSCISIAIVVLVAVFVLFAGCTSQSTGQSAPAVTGTPDLTTSPAPVAASAGTTSASLPYGVIISYPDTWTRQDVHTNVVRDYGTTTVNIANFYSPDAIPGDTASYNTLSVDVDQNPREGQPAPLTQRLQAARSRLRRRRARVRRCGGA